MPAIDERQTLASVHGPHVPCTPSLSSTGSSVSLSAREIGWLCRLAATDKRPEDGTVSAQRAARRTIAAAARLPVGGRNDLAQPRTGS